MKRRWFGAGAVVVLLVVIGLGVHASVADHSAGSPNAERAAALNAAHQVQRTVKGAFLVATYPATPSPDRHRGRHLGGAVPDRRVIRRRR